MGRLRPVSPRISNQRLAKGPWMALSLFTGVVLLALYDTLYLRSATCPVLGRPFHALDDPLANPLLHLPPDLTAAKSGLSFTQSSSKAPINGEYCTMCTEINSIGPAAAPAPAPAPSPAAAGQLGSWASSPASWIATAGAKVSRHRWCRDANSTETLPHLRRVALLRSAKPRPARGVTVVTQLSVERLDMLRHQCSLWPHPIAAAVYVPLLRGAVFSADDRSWAGAPLERAVVAVAALHAAAETDRSGCVLDIEIVAEERCTDLGALVYPTNALRNRALHLAGGGAPAVPLPGSQNYTDLVLLLDADFLVGRSLAAAAEDSERHAAMKAVLAQGAAFVLPAFETEDHEAALAAARRGKTVLAPLLAGREVTPFHACRYRAGHRASLSLHWATATAPYRISYEVSYEPYLLMLRRTVPWYDERFCGLFRDKMEFVMHVAVQERTVLLGHPDHFVIHMPHQKSASISAGVDAQLGLRVKNERAFNEAYDAMAEGQYVPVTSFSHLCLPAEVQRAVAAAGGVGAVQRAALLDAAPGTTPKLPGPTHLLEAFVEPEDVEEWRC